MESVINSYGYGDGYGDSDGNHGVLGGAREETQQPLLAAEQPLGGPEDAEDDSADVDPLAAGSVHHHNPTSSTL